MEIMTKEPLVSKRFCEDMVEAVQQLLGCQYQVEHILCQKNNGSKKDGLLIKKEGSNVAPSYHLAPMYEQFKRGYSIMELSRDLVKEYLHSEEEHGKVADEWSNLSDRSHVLNNVVYRVVNRDLNKGLLETIPYSPIDEDLVKIFYVTAVQSNQFRGTMTITDSFMDSLGLTLAELEEYAEENTPNLLKPSFKTMGSMLSSLCSEYEDTETEASMWVLTNESKMYGASTIFYDGLMESISELLGSDLYIIPSSLHEVILMKAPLPQFEGFMQSQIRSINSDSSIMSREDVLSDKLYYYKRHSNLISVV